MLNTELELSETHSTCTKDVSICRSPTSNLQSATTRHIFNSIELQPLQDTWYNFQRLVLNLWNWDFEGAVD